MAKTDGTELWLQVRHIDDTVVLTATEAWTWLRIPGISTNLPTQEEINEMVRSVEAVLLGIGKDVELHYHLAYRDHPLEPWATALENSASEAQPAWADYVRRMRMRIRTKGFQERVLFLGVKLGRRDRLEKPNTRGATPMQVVSAFGRSIAAYVAGPDPQPSAKEVARWHRLARKVHQHLGAGRLAAVPAKATDTAWLIRHVQRLGMPDAAPLAKGRTWGAGQVRSLSEAVVDNKADPSALTLKFTGRNTRLDQHAATYRALEAQHQPGQPLPMPPSPFHESYVAVLPVAELPDEIASPWLFHASTLPFPVEISARVAIDSHERAEKDARKAERNARELLEHAAESNTSGHGRDRARAQRAARLHEELAAGEGLSQIRAAYRLIVTGSTRTEVGERAEEVIRHFKEEGGYDIAIEWPPGDQLTLWQEMIPGELVRTRVYEQRQDLITFCLGLPFSISQAGDNVGPYIGEIMTGNPAPVMYDMATAARLGRAPTLALTGTLGGGKTNLLLTLMDHFRLRGYPIIALDPKGDIKSHLALTGRGDARFFELTKDGKAGSLDPFTQIPFEVATDDPERDTHEKAHAKWREETRALVHDVVELLLEEVMTPTMATAVQLALNHVMMQPQPSMALLMETLKAGGISPGTELGISEQTMGDYKLAALGAHANLLNAAESSLGRLMFAPPSGDGQQNLFTGGVRTTIVSLSGLQLPTEGAGKLSLTQRFSLALFSLVAHQSRRMLQDLGYVGPRLLAIDEAHQITAMPSGRAMIVSNARMGRSRDIAMILATQSAADLAGPDLRNAISAVFAFRTGDGDERSDVARLLGRDNDPTVLGAIPTDNSPAGMCLMRDLNRNIALVQIDRWVSEYVTAFETNPDRKNVAAAGQRFPTDQFGVVRDPESASTQDVAPVEQPTAAPLPPVLPAPAVAAAAAAGEVPTRQEDSNNDAYLTPVAAVPTQPVAEPAPNPLTATGSLTNAPHPVAMPPIPPQEQPARPIPAPTPVTVPAGARFGTDETTSTDWWGED